ncbi:MAG: hypothetical protein E6Q67_10375 [Roseateles sp.]|nr:MAG: hypothetical protein E6Q67_10375 [Roseateles sp.]
MFYLICWGLVAVLMGLWSLAAWGLHDGLRWAASQAGGLGDLAPQLRVPEWLGPWLPLPPELLTRWLQDLAPVLAQWLEALGPVGGGALTAVAWTLWAAGAVVILLLGLGLHLALLLWRRWSRQSPAVLASR